MKIGHSNRVLGILQAILESDPDGEHADPQLCLFPAIGSSLDCNSTSSVACRLDEFVLKWNDEEVEKVVLLLRDWNTNAKNCFVCTCVLSSLLRVCGVGRLTSSRPLLESLPGLMAYTERHYQRICRLHQGTHLSDYFSSLMSLMPLVETSRQDKTTMKEIGGDVEREKRVRQQRAPVLFEIENSVPKSLKKRTKIV